jgi:ABC-2 type transport system ATP-binding protein
MSSILSTESLTRRYGRTEAVHDLTLSVPEGSVFAFVGPNGAGKTTTIKTVMNILEPTSGRASLLGVDSRRIGPRELQQVGYVSENQEMPEWMTVRQLCDYLTPLYPTWDAPFAEQLRQQFDLPGNRAIKTFSRGMRMKAALLSSLAYHPKLLVLDEPFAGLDALVRDEVIQGVLELTQQAHWSVFISSHDIDEVERLADWIGVINEGHLQFAEPVASLLARFRQVAVTFEGEAELPASLPVEWRDPDRSGRVARFVDSAWTGTDDEGRIRQVLPGVSVVEATPMSLKSIFISLARGFRRASTGAQQ